MSPALSAEADFNPRHRCSLWMPRCEHCGSAMATGESVCPVCNQRAPGPLSAVNAWTPPLDVGGVEFASTATWTRPKPLPDAAVEAGVLRVRIALAAVLLLAGANVWLGFAQSRIIDVIGGVVFAVLLFFIRRKSLVALMTAAALEGAISLGLILTGHITLILAIAIRATILVAILQAIGPMQLLRARDRMQP